MIASEKSHENQSDRSQFLFKKGFDVNKKPIFSGETITISDSCIYNYAQSYFGEDFYSNALYWFIYIEDKIQIFAIAQANISAELNLARIHGL